MAAEYNRITLPRGSQVYIANCRGTAIAKGALLEDYTLSLSSDFGQLVDTGANTAFDMLGGALKSLSGNRFGFSSQFKQMGFQIWKGTHPIQFQFSLEFHYTYNAREEVVIPIRKLIELPLPGESTVIPGNLIPPGPSVIEALTGSNASNTPMPSSAAVVEGVSEESLDSFVNITIGGMQFLGCIVTGAEPTYSKFVDEHNCPIYGRVALTAITMYSATKGTVRDAMG
ncbi:MAG: hypothetical protein LBV17_12230 [Treponema sp.]|jgi:hypothetical protein|nr:hypothetical protein [Treponema sp.]